MPEKRKLSTRPRRESAKKRARPTASGSPARNPTPPEPSRDPLPHKITKDTALPTIKGDFALLDQSLQSIAESGVLAASLNWSLHTLIGSGLFERYWVKPSKKKGYQEDPKNPSKETMLKLGNCKIIIEPHILDATLHAIRQPQATPRPAAQISMANPIMQYTPSAAENSAPPAPPNSQLDLAKPAKASPLSAKSTVAASSVHPPAASASSLPQTCISAPKQASPTARPTTQVNTTNSVSASPLPPKHPSQDPVIQMLAQRASTSPELKVLMKIVASGKATPDQLKVFQSHIDDLTAILQRGSEAANQKVETEPSAATTGVSHNQDTPTTSANATPVQMAKKAPVTTQTQASFQVPPAPASMKTKAVTSSSPKAEIAGIAIEFDTPGSTNDRFLFPKNAILEWTPQSGEIQVSFLIVRKPNNSSSSNYLKTKEYYQPVTMRIHSQNSKVLDAIPRAVAPVEEVRTYMENIIATKRPADNGCLALRLPIEGQGGEVGNGSGADTPAKSGGGKKSSGSKSTVPASLARNAASGTKKNKAPAWLDSRCQFCLETVAATAPLLHQRPVCKSCWDLRTKDMQKHGMGYPATQNSGDIKESQAAGPQYLAL